MSEAFTKESLRKVAIFYDQTTFSIDVFTVILEFLCYEVITYHDFRRSLQFNQIKDHHMFVNGIRHGECKGYHPLGNIKYCFNYECGKEQGYCKWWYDNGQIELHCTYRDGVVQDPHTATLGEQDIIYKTWHKDGNPARFTYPNGELFCECTWIDKKGLLFYTRLFGRKKPRSNTYIDDDY